MTGICGGFRRSECDTKGRIHYFVCKGRNTSLCGDKVYFRENGEYGWYSLADGIDPGSCIEDSRIGARKVQKAIADAFEEMPEYFFQEPVSEIKALVIEIIRDFLYNLRKEHGDAVVREAASTLQILMISRKHNICRWLHLGDGLLAKEDVRGEIEIVSHGQNGITSQFTFTTASEPLERYVRMGENHLEEIRRFFLFTNGASGPFYRNRELTENGKEFLQKGTDVFGRILQQLQPADDYSVLEIGLQ